MQQGMRAYRGKYVTFLGALMLALFFLGRLGAVRSAHAGDAGKAKKEITQNMKEAMENFDLLEY